MKRVHRDMRHWNFSPLRLPRELAFLQHRQGFFNSWRLCHAGKIFPLDTLVALNGVGICRVVSDPYLSRRCRYPHVDVEAFGERICVDVTEITPISN